MTLTRDEILARRTELPRTTVHVPELGGDVTILTLTLKQVREINRLQKANTEPLAIYPKVVSLGCADGNGHPLFEGEDIKLIDELPFAATDTIANAVLRFNKMTGDKDEEDSENGVPKE